MFFVSNRLRQQAGSLWIVLPARAMKTVGQSAIVTIATAHQGIVDVCQPLQTLRTHQPPGQGAQYRETQKYITREEPFLYDIAEYFCDNGGCNLFASSSNLKLGATLFPNFVQKTGCHFSENFWALSVQFSSFNATKVCFIFERASGISSESKKQWPVWLQSQHFS